MSHATSAPHVVDPAPSPVAGPLSGQHTAQDFGNVICMEHVNLEVPDLEVARMFYEEGLGLTIDPSKTGAQRGGSHVMWYNVGRQQLHICKGPHAQRLPQGGAIGLVLPDVGGVAHRLEGLQSQLGDIAVTRLSHHTLEVKDPHGVTFIIHDVSAPPGAQEDAQQPVCDPHIAYLLLPCFPGTAVHIARFYADRLGALVRVSGGRKRSDGSKGLIRGEVLLGLPGTRLVFTEQPGLPAWSEQAAAALYDGWHVCFYIADFSGTYSRCQPLLFNSHPYRDKVHSFDDALRNRQFRFQDIRATPLPAHTVSAAGPSNDIPAAQPTPDDPGPWLRQVPEHLVEQLPACAGAKEQPAGSAPLLYGSAMRSAAWPTPSSCARCTTVLREASCERWLWQVAQAGDELRTVPKASSHPARASLVRVGLIN
eukprot:CAMPEP_0202859776 /NCGR_PEP_ID=MMETSP1391-20130828/1749_1 /ASSEMBLY_ACC=CAM_ASM_000867 /TAXON_ID=1034604 /ORGANISM="Chlamydomonas leiostraca, Strain SAG 11-49" /LENGTH=422 /DNA_ID=CAMNT_0049538853 /DNA_START=174 /DNA_END=1443 /DNA_ORIENTATION=-